MADLDFSRFDVLSFDCYGTLIDWETGILAGLHAVLDPRGVAIDDERLLEAFGRHEAELEAGRYMPYRRILGEVLRRICAEHAVEPNADEIETFGGSVVDWPAFPDSPPALARLHERFGLAVVTNCDDDLFAASNVRLGVTFGTIVTAEQARRYKPNPRSFELAFERIGLPTDRILHVAQSLFHDHVPAKRLGLRTVWVDRRHDRAGFGATPRADARPDLVVPDMATLADLATR